MSIPARLSRILHVTLGEDGAADMVTWMQSVDDHRAELRELNELSVARLEARFGQVEARFGQVEARIGQVEARLEARIDIGLKALDAKIDVGLKALDAKIDVGLKALEGKIDQRFGDLIKWSFVFWCGAVAAAMFARG